MGISISRKILWAIFVAIILGTLAPEVAGREPKPPELPPKVSQYIKDSLDVSGTRIKEFFAPLGKIGVTGIAAYLLNKISKKGIGVVFVCIGLLIIITQQGFNHRYKTLLQEREGEVRVKTDSDGIDISARGTLSYIFGASGFVLIVGGIALIILNP